MSSASQAARAERNAEKKRKCNDVLRISSTEDGKRFFGRPNGDAQRPFATLFYCEETGVHKIHRQIEELEDGTCIDISWASADQSQYRDTPNPLLVGKPQMGKWLPRTVKSDKIRKEVLKPIKVKAEDW